MPNRPPLMKLSRDEANFLRHWMYDEAHYREGSGPAKRLQREHRAVPAHQVRAELAVPAQGDGALHVPLHGQVHPVVGDPRREQRADGESHHDLRTNDKSNCTGRIKFDARD